MPKPFFPSIVLCALSAVVFAVCSAGCSLTGSGGNAQDSVIIISYNVQNLFDAEDSGNEYPEFSLASGDWNADLYAKRLGNVKKAVDTLLPAGKRGPDILCLVEVENRRVLDDLGKGPFAGAGYAVSLISPAEGSAINSGILSRFPLLSSRAHALAGPSPNSRNMLEATFAIGPETTLTVLLCHWKSRKEGKETTEGARIQAANLVRRRISELLAADPDAEIIVCGDFNESPDEYFRSGKKYATAFMPATDDTGTGGGEKNQGLVLASRPEDAGFSGGIPILFSPWASSTGYSYVFKGERERLDGFLLSPGLCDTQGLMLSSFSSSEADFLLSATGEPLGWRGRAGYSDHLPIALTLALDKKNKHGKDRSIVYDKRSGLH